eukprot:TRINITY_DN8926_c0_g1_i1.p1 TRINITY_DN8926_c0_g1~~TRINITY_DN8926_c0_g1_i1.p1  ORF type:complete len:320 (+),score=35.04 TRINITY_DN8926_c0_g1_i1:107-1066(+)
MLPLTIFAWSNVFPQVPRREFDECHRAQSKRPATGHVPGFWLVAYENWEVGNVTMFNFKQGWTALAEYIKHTCAKCLFDATGKEHACDAAWNQMALNTVRGKVSWTTSMAVGRWMVVTEEGDGNVKFYKFDHEKNARKYFEGLKVTRILYDATHLELEWGGPNLLARNTIRAHVARATSMVKGSWMVVTEEGIGDVKFYKFDHEKDARNYFEGLKVTRILYDATHLEREWGGPNHLARNTIRAKVSHTTTMVKGTWMVVTEEGIGNVKFYRFPHGQDARKYFEGLHVTRVLYDTEHRETDSGGHHLAKQTIRRTAEKQR